MRTAEIGEAFPNNRAGPLTLAAAIGGAREGSHGVVAAGIAEGTSAVTDQDEATIKTLSVSAWALVHGATQLLIANIVERDRGEDLGERLPERAVGLFVRGLCADAACGDVVPPGRPAPSRRRHAHG